MLQRQIQHAALPLISRRVMTKAMGTVALAGAFAGTALARAAHWQLLNDKDGIKVYRQELAGSPLHAFRGTATIDVSMEKLIWILADEGHRKDWVDRLEKSVVLEEKNTYDFIVYQHYKSPPVISDRDFVYRARGFTKPDGSTILMINSVKHAKAPPTVGVRAHLEESSYIFKPLGKSQTFVDIRVLADPKGNLPNWLVNLVQKSWPRNTLIALRKHAKKPFIGRLSAPPRT